ncbi:hypothetical protein Cflav_PD2644 [Pedosphaera parvula Ellin514]|uniref:Uncharacterized protein n=1 Tax=Pedosphaera parvula (strain Ellin514) TaxID=320771 RepID=B9XKI5_PEDPL|nr:hypothetical protein Cflav_PD2644 [Pedosphaera parvula Ellin514]
MPSQSRAKITRCWKLPQLRNSATADVSPIETPLRETTLSQIIKRLGVTQNKIPLLKASNKGILETIGLRVERNGVAANILKGEPIWMRLPWFGSANNPS